MTTTTTKTDEGWDHSALLDMDYLTRILIAFFLLCVAVGAGVHHFFN